MLGGCASVRLEHASTTGAGLERVGSWVPGGSVGRDQLAMAAKVRRHWFNPCRLGSRGHLGANFSLLLYTDLIKKRKPSRYFTDEGELIRNYHDGNKQEPTPEVLILMPRDPLGKKSVQMPLGSRVHLKSSE